MKKEQTIAKLKERLEADGEILLCFLFGSVLKEQENFNSDIDVAIAENEAMSASRKQGLIEKLALTFERPVDLVDLQVANGMILHQILTKGELVFCDDHPLYAEIIKKMLYNQSDFMPYYHRILRERREKWINE